MTHYDDDDAFENGVLRDRARYHVPMHMRDSQAPMITDGTGDPLGLHRRGWRRPHRRRRTRCAPSRQSTQAD
jgi:hypothetical protein